MKRITALLLSLLMAVSLAACSQETVSQTEAENPPVESSSVSSEIFSTLAPVSEPTEGFVLIEGGTFQMGSPDSEPWRSADETQYTVTVSDFYISPYELTQAEYETLMGENPSNFSGEDLPVENVSWLDAVAYCNARSDQENLTPAYTINGTNVTWNREADGYRLPTEAEWEYACRAGTETPFNTENSPSAEEVNYYGHYPYDFAKNMRSAYRATLEPELMSFNIGIRLVRNAVAGSGTVSGAAVENASVGDGKILIAYFSWGGNTQGIAEEIQRQTGADLFEITMVHPYSDDYNTVLDEAQRDQNEQARPELAGHVENMEQYDTILLGYPTGGRPSPCRWLPSWRNMIFPARPSSRFAATAAGGSGKV